MLSYETLEKGICAILKDPDLQFYYNILLAPTKEMIDYFTNLDYIREYKVSSFSSEKEIKQIFTEPEFRLSDYDEEDVSPDPGLYVFNTDKSDSLGEIMGNIKDWIYYKGRSSGCVVMVLEEHYKNYGFREFEDKLLNDQLNLSRDSPMKRIAEISSK